MVDWMLGMPTISRICNARLSFAANQMLQNWIWASITWAKHVFSVFASLWTKVLHSRRKYVAITWDESHANQKVLRPENTERATFTCSSLIHTTPICFFLALAWILRGWVAFVVGGWISLLLTFVDESLLCMKFSLLMVSFVVRYLLLSGSFC